MADPGLVGWAVTLLVTPVAAARARVITWWTAEATLVGAGLYLLFAISPLPLNIIGPVVMIGAHGVAGWPLMRHEPAAEEPDTDPGQRVSDRPAGPAGRLRPAAADQEIVPA